MDGRRLMWANRMEIAEPQQKLSPTTGPEGEEHHPEMLEVLPVMEFQQSPATSIPLRIERNHPIFPFSTQ